MNNPPSKSVKSRQCGSCGAPIYWLRHQRTGRIAPINAAPDPEQGNLTIDLADGTYTFLPLDDRWQRAGFIELDPPDPQTLHTNHFMTCPAAESYKKRGGRNDTRPKRS